MILKGLVRDRSSFHTIGSFYVLLSPLIRTLIEYEFRTYWLKHSVALDATSPIFEPQFLDYYGALVKSVQLGGIRPARKCSVEGR